MQSCGFSGHFVVENQHLLVISFRLGTAFHLKTTITIINLASTNCTFFLVNFCLQYAQETQHEKILRGLAVGIAFTMYARLEEADPLVTSLTTDKDPVLRRSGMYTLAMAYCGTGSNKAIRKLLHIAVSILTIAQIHHSKKYSYAPQIEPNGSRIRESIMK